MLKKKLPWLPRQAWQRRKQSQMMDMYSDNDMPSLEQRKKDLFDYSKKIGIVSPNIDQEIERIILETPDYSMSGYCSYGRFEEQSKLRKVFGK